MDTTDPHTRDELLLHAAAGLLNTIYAGEWMGEPGSWWPGVVFTLPPASAGDGTGGAGEHLSYP
jgi:hypothetical protein